MIGSSDGKAYETEMDLQLNRPIIAEDTEEKTKKEEPFIDHDHHVPLVATALMDKDGQMTGMAVDHRLNFSDQDLKLLHLHESTELPWMQDYMKAGMSAPDAYHKAHDHATARETAASIAQWGEDGHEAYQQRMRDATAIASLDTDRGRHPDAHTTRYGLDESELGRTFDDRWRGEVLGFDRMGGDLGITENSMLKRDMGGAKAAGRAEHFDFSGDKKYLEYLNEVKKWRNQIEDAGINIPVKPDIEIENRQQAKDLHVAGDFTGISDKSFGISTRMFGPGDVSEGITTMRPRAANENVPADTRVRDLAIKFQEAKTPSEKQKLIDDLSPGEHKELKDYLNARNGTPYNRAVETQQSKKELEDLAKAARSSFKVVPP